MSHSILFLCALLPAAPPAAVEEQILAARRRIVRGELVIDSRDVSGSILKDPHPPVPCEHRLWFDGDKVRHDRLFRSPAGNPNRMIKCRNCPNRNDFIRHTIEPGNRAARVLQLARIRPDEQTNEWFDVLDPRGLGMVSGPAANLVNSRYDAFVGSPDRTNVSASDQVWNGKPCVRIDFTARTGAAGQIWAVPEWDHNVVRIFGTATVNGVAFVQSLEVEVARVGPDGPWFPAKCTYSDIRDGRSRFRLVERIQVKSLNQPIDPRVFQLAGMDIPPRTLVTDPNSPTPKLLEWDGEKLGPPNSVVHGPPPAPSVVERPSPWAAYRPWLWAASCVAAVGAAAAAWRSWKR
jgi:hypothetical protein